jgi:hypothetical protein
MCNVLADQDACSLYAGVKARVVPGTRTADYRDAYSRLRVVPAGRW